MDIANMNEAELLTIIRQGNDAARELERRRQREKLREYNRKLHALFAEAEADGIRFVYHGEDCPWCSDPLTPTTCEAVI